MAGKQSSLFCLTDNDKMFHNTVTGNWTIGSSTDSSCKSCHSSK